MSFDTHNRKLNLQYRLEMSGSEEVRRGKIIKMKGNVLIKTWAVENLFNLRKLPFFVLSTVWKEVRRRVRTKFNNINMSEVL